MASHGKAKRHHAEAGKALERGDLKAAAQHFGHALSACRNPDQHDDDTGLDTSSTSAAPVPKMGIRDRLKAAKKG